MKVFLFFHLVMAAILVTNISSGSYLTMDVSSNPILSGLTKTLTMSCYIRSDSPRPAPYSVNNIDTVEDSDTEFGTVIDDTSINVEDMKRFIEEIENSTTITTMRDGIALIDTTTAPTTTAPTTMVSTTTPTATNTRQETTQVPLDSRTTTIPSQKPQVQVTSSPADVSHLMALVITKRNSPGEDETVARVTPYDPAAADGSYVGFVKVNGSVFHTLVNGELGFLSLTWSASMDGSVGTYTCEADGLTHSGHLVTLTGSLEIQARQPNVADLVPFIVAFENRISQLEQENQELKHRLDMLKV